MDRINITLPTRTINNLKHVSSSFNISVSEVLRRYIEQCIEKDLKACNKRKDGVEKSSTLKDIINQS